MIPRWLLWVIAMTNVVLLPWALQRVPWWQGLGQILATAVLLIWAWSTSRTGDPS